MHEPVAVLICLYGRDRLDWVKEAIESVQAQDYQGDIRIYLGVDGPLADDVQNWLGQHQAVFHKIVWNRDNIGLSKTLNGLLPILEDEAYVFRLDADDLCMPYRFARQVKFLQEHVEVDVVGGAIWEYDERAKAAWLKSYPQNHDNICRYIIRANPLAHSAVCFRRRFFTRVAAYPDRYRYNQDLAMWVAGLRHGVIMANLDLPVVCLRTPADFYGRRGVARAVSELRAYLAAIRFLHGWSWRMLLPMLRFLSRLLPPTLVQRLYRGKARAWACRVDKFDSGMTPPRADGDQ